MKRTWTTLALVVAVLLLAIYAIVPPEQSLRRGKDLAGGVSMIYAVQIGPSEDHREIMPRLIDALKRRLDPTGVMEVQIVSMGRDRIEISMPLPNDEVKALKAAFEQALAELGAASLNAARVDLMVKAPPADRASTLASLSAGSDSRRALLEKAVAAWDAYQQAKQAYDAAPDAAAKRAMELGVGAALIAYEDARDAAIRGAVSAEEILAIVNASKTKRSVSGKDGAVQLDSAREVAERRVRAAHPEAAADIDRLLALHSAYEARRKGFDDPQDVVRLLRNAGVLSFRITVKPGEYPGEQQARDELRERGPGAISATDVKWCRINEIQTWIETPEQARAFNEDPNYGARYFGGMGYVVEPFGGSYYMLCWDTRAARLTQEEGSWAVARSYPGVDSYGRASINFQMNTNGAILLGRLTGDHIGDQMAVLLDDEVYTAPNLRGRISSNGSIEGKFSPEEIQYVVRVLGGGSLQAKLVPEPLSINAVGPELGADNLRKGVVSGIYSIIIVAGFMILYYFSSGVVAVVSLFVNSMIIVGAMAVSQAAFTMPGIAGLILTFGMAVDSNVLIYERVREELQRGADLKTAIRLGFDRALASIVDGNVTNLIVCVVLYYLGTTEIKGFAVTMGVGVVATLFSALVVSRLIFTLMLAAGWRKTSMLPMALPGIQRLLTPNVNWIRLRYVFAVVSLIYVGLGIGLIAYQGSRMLDNEFLGGTVVTLQLGSEDARVTMRRPDVEARVRQVAEEAPAGDELRKLASAEVYPIDPEADGVTSDQFQIKTVIENSRAVLDAVLPKFRDVTRIKPPLDFRGADVRAGAQAPVFPIDKEVLGQNIDRPEVTWSVRGFMGGAAIVIDDISPPEAVRDLAERVHSERQTAEFSDTLSRKVEVQPLSGTDDAATAAVILVYAPDSTLFESQARWERDVRDREWTLVQRALTRATTPASVQNFSASVASTFRADAITASLVSFLLIGVYIWVRFKTPRYSLAAVVALVHDVVTVVGLLALCEILYEWEATQGFAIAIGLLPFKIDLNAVAALLTIAGYSLNDTVVVMDRIRENRGKLPHATSAIINLSINQTFSRTVITGGTTIGSCLILYAIGGEGMRSFAFCLLTGLIVGTYSSVAVAAPLVWSRKFDREFAAMGGITPQAV
ncbi:MAG: protein translocase subunit SecD [Planctomycetota bacterium]|nr:protein translocase subunit SecD [Planctomycetota bacterium]